MDGKAMPQHVRCDVHVAVARVAASGTGALEDGLPGCRRHLTTILSQPKGDGSCCSGVDQSGLIADGELIDGNPGWACG
jgi:hypothetical protein